MNLNTYIGDWIGPSRWSPKALVTVLEADVALKNRFIGEDWAGAPAVFGLVLKTEGKHPEVLDRLVAHPLMQDVLQRVQTEDADERSFNRWAVADLMDDAESKKRHRVVRDLEKARLVLEIEARLSIRVSTQARWRLFAAEHTKSP